jgi:hypothetical protein
MTPDKEQEKWRRQQQAIWNEKQKKKQVLEKDFQLQLKHNEERKKFHDQRAAQQIKWQQRGGAGNDRER